MPSHLLLATVAAALVLSQVALATSITATKTLSLSRDWPTEQPTTTEPSTTTAHPAPPAPSGVYTNATFVTSSPYWLVANIRAFLNASDARYGTISSICNATAVNYNYTCVVTFSNRTQAADAVFGGNRRLITAVWAAWLDGYTTTPASGSHHIMDGDRPKVAIVIGIIAAVLVVGALIGAAAVVTLRRRRSNDNKLEDANRLISVN